MYILLRPSGWQKGWEPAPASRFDTGPCLRCFGIVSASRPVHVLQGVFTLKIILGQASAFLLSARRQGRLFRLPTGVRRHIGNTGVNAIAEQTGMARELEALLAVNDAVNWSAVSTLPPFREPQAGALPLPRYSLLIRRATLGEDHLRGLASTEAVADLGVPVFLPDPLQVVVPWFFNPTPMGTGRRYSE